MTSSLPLKDGKKGKQMQSADKKKTIAYASALTFLFSMLETIVPKPLPFFRLGLANIPLLLVLPLLDFPSYLLLLTFKWLGGGLISGTLFSFFGLMSAFATAGGGISMYALWKWGGKKVTYWGISAFGALVNSLIQLLLSSLYLGRGTWNFLPLMLSLSLLSSLLVAFLAFSYPLPEIIPEIRTPQRQTKTDTVPLALALLAIISIALCTSLPALGIALLLALLLQALTHRRIHPLPYLMVIFSSILISLLVPGGRIIWRFITSEALRQGFLRGLALSSMMAISQSLSTLNLPFSSVLSSSFSYYAALQATFAEEKGPLKSRIIAAMRLEGNAEKKIRIVKVFPTFPYILTCLLIILIVLISRFQAFIWPF